MSQHFYFDIWPPDDYVGAALGELSEASDRKVREADQSIGEGSFEINRHSSQAAWCEPRALVRVRLTPGGPFAYDDPRYVAAFFIESSDDVALSEDEQGGETLTRGGPSVVSILKRAINYPNANISGHASYWTSAKITGDIIIKNKTVGEAFRILILNAMDRAGNLPGVTIDFTISNDSSGTPWPDTDTDWRFPVGMSILEALSKLVSSKSYYRMGPDLLLQVFEDHPGTDRSGSITFSKGESVVETASKTIDASNFMSRALVRGQKAANELTYLQVFDTGVEAETGRVEGYVEYQTTPTTARLTRAGQQAIDRSKLQQDGPVTAKVYAVEEPFVDYTYGDTVTVDIPGVYDSSEVRIAAITLEETEGGEYDVIHEYQAVPFDPASGPDNFASSTGPGGGTNCGDCPDTPPFVPDVSGSTPVFAVLYGPNNRPDRAFYPRVGWYGDGDAPPTGYASAPKTGPIEYVDRTVNGLTQRWALRALADMTVDIVVDNVTMAEVYRAGSWSSTFRLIVNGAVVHSLVTPESCPDLCYFADTYDHTESGVTLHAGDVVEVQAFWSYGGVPVVVPAGTDGGSLTITGTAGAVVAANEPIQGQWVGEEVIVAEGDTTYATNYAYSPNGLHVYAEGVHIVVDQTDPTAGTFALASELPAGTHLFLWYQATTGDYLGTGNPPAPGPRNGIIPYPLLGTNGDGSGTHRLGDDGIWHDVDDGTGTSAPIDRATLRTEVLVAALGPPMDLNLDHGTDSDGGGNKAFTNPTNANDEAPDIVSPTYASVGSFAAGVSTNKAYLVADLGPGGATDVVTEHVVWGDYECSTDPTAIIAGVAPNGGWNIEYSDNGSSWSAPAVTKTRLGTPGTADHRVSFALTTPSAHRYWRIVYERDVAAGFAFMCGTDIHSWEISGSELSTTEWTDAPEASDADDSTYDAADLSDTDDDFLRADLGTAYRIARSRLLIGYNVSGSKTVTLWGANEEDWSDEVELDSATFTAGATYATSDIPFLWIGDTAYRYFRVKGAEELRHVFSFELYETDPSTLVVIDPTTGDPAELQDALDDIYAAIPTTTWEYLVDGNGWVLLDGTGNILRQQVAEYT